MISRSLPKIVKQRNVCNSVKCAIDPGFDVLVAKSHVTRPPLLTQLAWLHGIRSNNSYKVGLKWLPCHHKMSLFYNFGMKGSERFAFLRETLDPNYVSLVCVKKGKKKSIEVNCECPRGRDVSRRHQSSHSVNGHILRLWSPKHRPVLQQDRTGCI